MSIPIYEQRYLDSFKRPTADSGTPYKDSEDNILLLLYPEPIPIKYPTNLPPEQALAELRTFLKKSRPVPCFGRRAAALWRINQAVHSKIWFPDIVFKVFADLDTMYFNRRLHGNVLLRWITGEEMDERYSHSRNPGLQKGVRGSQSYLRVGPRQAETKGRILKGKSDIVLNATELLRKPADTAKEVVQVLIHEMIVSPLTKSSSEISHFVISHVSWVSNSR